MDVGFAYEWLVDAVSSDGEGNVITGDHILYIYGKYERARQAAVNTSCHHRHVQLRSVQGL